MEFLRTPQQPLTQVQPDYDKALAQLDCSTGHERLRLLGEVGNLARQLGLYSQAQEFFQEAVSLALTLQDQIRWAANTVRLGVALHHDGQWDPAIACFAAVLAAPNQGYHDFALQHLGKLQVEITNYPAARNCFEQALLLRQAKAETELIASTQAALTALHELEVQAIRVGESG